MKPDLSIKDATKRWEEFRKSIKESTPVAIDETHQEKTLRMTSLESDLQAWKQYYFPKYFKYPSPGFHIHFSNELHKNFNEKRHWYAVRHLARGLAKSTTTMFDVLYLVLTGKLKNVILTSSTYDAAEAFLTKYQAQLDTNQRIINDYGKQETPGAWSMGSFRTQKGVSFLALGAGQSPRGNGNEEVRPDCIIVDDFDTDVECRNPDIIKQKWEWFEQALFFTVDLAEPYLIIWNGNIIAEDCCVARAGKMADYCETINIRDANGVSVWPEKNKEEDIDYQIGKVSYESSQKEMFNNPIVAGKAFKEMRYGKCPPLSHLPFVVIYGDPATSNNDKPSAKSGAQNSCKAVAVVGFKGLTRYVYKIFVDHVGNSTFIDWLFTAHDWCHEAKTRFVFIENNSLQDPFYQQVLKPLIIQKSKKRGVMLPVLTDERRKGDKYTRIEGDLEPLNTNGLLILNIDEKEDPHMKRLESQFKSCSPNSKTMDGPDAVHGGVSIINLKAQGGTTKTEVRTPINKPKKRFS